MPPRGFRKAEAGTYVADRIVHMPKRNALTGRLYEGAFRAVIRYGGPGLWRLALEHVTDTTDHIEPTTHRTLNEAANAAEKAGWT